MGYWSNGSERRDWESRWCDRCAHGEDEEGGGCPVRLLHDLHAYSDQCRCLKPEGTECQCSFPKVQMRETLDLLIISCFDGNKYPADWNRCRMFAERRKAPTRQQQVMREIREAVAP